MEGGWRHRWAPPVCPIGVPRRWPRRNGVDAVGRRELASTGLSPLEAIHGVPVLLCAADGEAIGSEQAALDLIGDASYQGAQRVVIPAERFDESFFRLRSGLAGDIIQKFANYRLGLVVLGGISQHTAASSALRDWVRECNRGRQTWFLTDIGELRERLQPR